MAESSSERILECILCAERFSLRNVEDGSFFASTLICKGCYTEGVKDSEWCFGDFNAAEYRECRVECPDRKVCKVFTFQKRAKERSGGKI